MAMKTDFPAPEIARREAMAYFGGDDACSIGSLSLPSSRSASPSSYLTTESDSDSDENNVLKDIKAALGGMTVDGTGSSSDELAESWEDLA